MGKSSINGPFSMAMLNNQMVLISWGHHLSGYWTSPNFQPRNSPSLGTPRFKPWLNFPGRFWAILSAPKEQRWFLIGVQKNKLLLKIDLLHYWLVVSNPLKNISQLGWLFQIYGKIKDVPNHQPDYLTTWDIWMIVALCSSWKNWCAGFCCTQTWSTALSTRGVYATP